MIDFILNYLPKVVLYFLAEFFMGISILFAIFQSPDLSASSLNFSKHIISVYAPKVVELPVEFLKEMQKTLNKNK